MAKVLGLLYSNVIVYARLAILRHSLSERVHLVRILNGLLPPLEHVCCVLVFIKWVVVVIQLWPNNHEVGTRVHKLGPCDHKTVAL